MRHTDVTSWLKTWIREAVSLCPSPQTAALQKDLIAFKRQWDNLKPQPSPQRPRMLVVSLSSYLFQVKTECWLAAATACEGWGVDFLTWRRHPWSRRYFKATSLGRVLSYESYLRPDDQVNLHREIAALTKGSLSFQSVKKWTWRGVRVGQQALSTLARMHYGTPSLQQPSVRRDFEKILYFVMMSVCAAQRLLNETDYEVLLFNEANAAHYGSFYDVGFNMGKQIVQFVQPFRDDALILKRFDAASYGMHPNSVSRVTFEWLKQQPFGPEQEQQWQDEFERRYSGSWYLSARNFRHTQRLSASEVREALGLDPRRKVAVIFSHVLWDANLFYGEGLFEDYEDWFIQTLKAAARNDQVQWVVKLHPANAWKQKQEGARLVFRDERLIESHLGRLPSHMRLVYPEDPIHPLSLYDIADYGVTCRGTVGMELPCFGVPVLTAGTGRYSGLGFTIDSSTAEEYLERLMTIQHLNRLNEEVTTLARRHAYAVFVDRPLVLSGLRPVFKKREAGHKGPLDDDMMADFKTIGALESDPAFRKWRHWLCRCHDADYLESVHGQCGTLASLNSLEYDNPERVTMTDPTTSQPAC